VSILQASRLLGVHRTTAWRWLRAGHLPHYVDERGRLRIAPADVVAVGKLRGRVFV
jgi:excisionase family DNA binding protein